METGPEIQVIQSPNFSTLILELMGQRAIRARNGDLAMLSLSLLPKRSSELRTKSRSSKTRNLSYYTVYLLSSESPRLNCFPWGRQPISPSTPRQYYDLFKI